MILVAQIVLGISLAGIIIMLFRKIPALSKLTPEEEQFSSGPAVESETENGNSDSAAPAHLNNFLQKLLLRTKILNLKTENKIGSWLDRLRRKGKKEETEESPSDDYWEQLKNRQ